MPMWKRADPSAFRVWAHIEAHSLVTQVNGLLSFFGWGKEAGSVLVPFASEFASLSAAPLFTALDTPAAFAKTLDYARSSAM